MSSDVTIQWGFVDLYDDDGEKTTEPAMGIRKATLGGRKSIYAIPLSSAYKYADVKYLMEASFNVATFLGMSPDQFLINRIADLILNYLPDLVRKAPKEEDEGVECGEGILSVDGEIVSNFGLMSGGGIIR
jgi:hypothetical protein